MKKTTKGAVAAAASATLLLGGAGSLAYWNTTDTFAAGSFSTGELRLDATACDSNNNTWTLTNEVDASVNRLLDQAAFDALEIVPGDILTKRCDVDIIAAGDNLRATLAVTDGTTIVTPGDGALLDQDVFVDATFKVGTDTRTEITSADDITPMKVEIEFKFPLRPTVQRNVTQNNTISLTNFTVSALQVGATPPSTP